MLLGKIILFTTICFVALFQLSSSVFADSFVSYDSGALVFSEKSGSDLVLAIQKSLIESNESMASDPTAIFDGVYRVQKLFYGLPRDHFSHIELREVKYLMQHWRYQIKQKLIATLNAIHDQGDQAEEGRGSNGDYDDNNKTQWKQNIILGLLSKLDILLTEDDLNQIRDQLPMSDSQLGERFEFLVQDQGNHKLARNYYRKYLSYFKYLGISIDGPVKKLHIKPVYPSKRPYSKWSKNKKLSRYYRDTSGRVYFRGHFFENGDIIVLNQVNGTEGTFSIFSKGPGSATHSGIYVEMERNGKKYPAVFELHAQGTRFVPLNTFFSSDFIIYAEIYRLDNSLSDKNDDKEWQKRIPSVVAEISGEPHGYNFYGRSEDSQNGRYVTCTELVEMVLNRAGALTSSDFNQCPVTENAQVMLRKLDFLPTSLLTPTSFMRNPKFKMVGAFDSSDLKENIIKEIVLARLNQDVNAGRFFVENFQDTYLYKAVKFNLSEGIPVIGPSILRSLGKFTKDSAPAGPVGVMSLILPLDIHVAEATKKVKKYFGDMINDSINNSTTPFSFSQFMNVQLVNDETNNQKLEKIFKFFEKRNDPKKGNQDKMLQLSSVLNYL